MDHSIDETQPDPVKRFWELIDEILVIDERKKTLEAELLPLQRQLTDDFDPDDFDANDPANSADEMIHDC